MILKKIAFIALLFVGFNSFSQNVMTPELLWEIDRIGGIQVSPDGSKILFSVRKYDLVKNASESDLYVMPVAGGKPVKITNTASTEGSAQWRPDGKKIGFLSSENAKTRSLFEINPDGSELTQISSMEEPMMEFKYSPDGNIIAFTRDVKINKTSANEIHTDLKYVNARVYDDLMYRHWSSWDNGMRTHIFYAVIQKGKVQGNGVDIMKGENYDSPVKPFGGMEQVTFSADSKSITYACKKKVGVEYAKSTNTDLYNYHLETRETTVLTQGMNGYDMNPVYSPDGKYMAWLSMETDGFEADKNDIYIMDVKSLEKTNLTGEEDITVSDFIWGKDNETIYFKAVIEATYQLFELNVSKKKIRQITEGDHNYTSLALAGEFLIGGRQDMNHPTDIFKVAIKKGDQTQLTFQNDDIYGDLKTSKIEKRWVETTDGKKELVWVIFPPDFDPSKKYPALLYCQGGPQSAVSQFFSYRWNFQLMAANGYIVVAPNRRGLPGFGQEWNDAISRDWGGQPMDDYLSAIDELKKESYIDENRIGAVGASYGGYSVYYLAGMHEDRFKCFISHCGLFNLESWYGTTEELFFANEDIGGPYWEDLSAGQYKNNSPHKMVKKWNTPMLIFHGEQDFRVPVNQGMEAYQACQLLGIDSKLILFPEENHWVLSPQNGVFWHREFYAWLDTYLKK